jgi:hypothetical protein
MPWTRSRAARTRPATRISNEQNISVNQVNCNKLTLHNFFGNYLEPIAYLIFLLAVVLFAKKQNSPCIRLLRSYYVLVFLLMLTASLLVIWDYHTNWLYHIHAFATLWMLGIYYRGLFHDARKKMVPVVCIGGISLYLLFKLVVQRQYELFDSIGFSLVSASVVIYIFLYFHQLLSNVTDQNIFQDFNFWLSSGFLIYFLGNFIIFLTYHYFTLQILATYTDAERDILTNLWGLHNCLLFVGALSLLGGSLWIVYRRRSALS